MNGALVTDLGFALVRYRVLVILAVTFSVASIWVPGFFSAGTLSLSLDRAATMGLLAVGLTVVLLAGQLDLSGGAVLALAGITAIGLQESMGQIPAAFVGVMVGVLAGGLNAFLVVVLRINSLVATLASMLFIRAVGHYITDSRPVSGIDPFFGLTVSRPIEGTITGRSLLFLVAIVVLHFWLTRTVSGRNMFAVGSNFVSATASGVRSRAYLAGSFVFSGAMAGIAGVIQSLSVNTGSPVFGESIVLTAIAAVVIGGTRLEGGRASAGGTLGGVLTLGALTTAMEFQNIPAYIQQIAAGLILLLLILLDQLVSRRDSRDVGLRSLVRRMKALSRPHQEKERKHISHEN
jgi:ribose/xylose/arabinose/galactoside ABC-type transport system permease subunit